MQFFEQRKASARFALGEFVVIILQHADFRFEVGRLSRQIGLSDNSGSPNRMEMLRQSVHRRRASGQVSGFQRGDHFALRVERTLERSSKRPSAFKPAPPRGAALAQFTQSVAGALFERRHFLSQRRLLLSQSVQAPHVLVGVHLSLHAGERGASSVKLCSCFGKIVSLLFGLRAQ